MPICKKNIHKKKEICMQKYAKSIYDNMGNEIQKFFYGECDTNNNVYKMCKTRYVCYEKL